MTLPSTILQAASRGGSQKGVAGGPGPLRSLQPDWWWSGVLQKCFLQVGSVLLLRQCCSEAAQGAAPLA